MATDKNEYEIYRDETSYGITGPGLPVPPGTRFTGKHLIALDGSDLEADAPRNRPWLLSGLAAGTFALGLAVGYLLFA